MMTGRDLIIYILNNSLEDEPVYDKETSRVLGFMTMTEAAMKFEVGVLTIIAWVELSKLDGVTIGNKIYIPVNACVKTDKEGGNDGKESYKCLSDMLSNSIDDGIGENAIFGPIDYRGDWRFQRGKHC